MRKLFLYVFPLIFSFGCERILIKSDIENTVQNNFKLFWEDVDQRCVLFPYNHINWDSVYTSCYLTVNGNNLKETLVSLGYFLKDGHFALYTPEKNFYAFQRFIILLLQRKGQHNGTEYGTFTARMLIHYLQVKQQTIFNL